MLDDVGFCRLPFIIEERGCSFLLGSSTLFNLYILTFSEDYLSLRYLNLSMGNGGEKCIRSGQRFFRKESVTHYVWERASEGEKRSTLNWC